ncbi:MAG: capsular polysaccharide biosynthesis protein [Desulfovibrio sp.]|nr:capsular polysaccharide biosynthesis protein [Desulfovibrio sp.]
MRLLSRIFRSVLWIARRKLAALLPRVPRWVFAFFLLPKEPWYICFAKGMKRIPTLEDIVERKILFMPPNLLAHLLVELSGTCIGVLVWGVKEEEAPIPMAVLYRQSLERTQGSSGLLVRLLAICRAYGLMLAHERLRYARGFALSFAKNHGIGLVRVEDGFLRSLDLGVHGALPLSLVVDHTGIYYDARNPSDLENLLNSSWEVEDPERAKAALSAIVTHSLSKYNHANEAPKLPESTKQRILLIDQTKGDMSIHLGLASAETFQAMLTDALTRYPNAEIFIKVHPDVLGGKKEGHFDRQNLPNGVTLLACDCAPLSLLAQMDVVYTVTSQMGFEALFLGKEVHTFGMPFYAGWGLTQDHIQNPRRIRSRTLLDLFWAAYAHYTRYCLSVGERAQIESCIKLLVLQRRIDKENAGYHACLGFSRWKEIHAKAFLQGTHSEVAFFTDPSQALSQAKAHRGNLVVWASKLPADLPDLAEEAQVPLLRMEDGFVRSVGLGSNFNQPGSLVLDSTGIYYDPKSQSQLERILLEERTAEELEIAKHLRSNLVAKGISKYNVSGALDLPILPKDRPILLVPGQVEDDASVRLGGEGIFSNQALLEHVRKSNPSCYILYKEHPDVVSGNRAGAVPKKALAALADGVVRTSPIEMVLPLCNEVHTLTSLTGFEALLRGIPVVTYGGPFYAGWGLTRDRLSFPRREKRLTLDALVAGVLVVYPRYYDWTMRMAVDCRLFVDCLAKARSKR